MQSRLIALFFLLSVLWASGQPVQDQLDHGRDLLAKGEIRQAEELANRLVRQAPGLAGAYALRAQISEHQLLSDKALTDMSIAVGLEPENAEYRFRRGLLAYQAGRLDLARSDFRTVLRLRPTPTQTVFYRQNSGGTDRVLTMASGVADQILHYLALTEMKAGSYQRAKDLLDSAIRLNPADADMFAHRGFSRERCGDAAGSRADYKRAFELAPHHALVLLEQAREAEAKGDLIMAESCLTQAISANPKLSEAWSNRASFHYRQGKYTAALSDCDSALRLNPAGLEDWINRGSSLEKIGRREDARAALETALQLDGRSPQAWFQMGSLLYRSKEWQEAAEHFTIALQLDSTNALAYYNRALARQQTKTNVNSACQDLLKAETLGIIIPDAVRRRLCIKR